MGRKERKRKRDRSASAPGERRRPAREQAKAVKGEPFRPTPRTWAFGGAGLVTVVLGFVLLEQGSIALAPILLVLGFLVLFPLALVK